MALGNLFISNLNSLNVITGVVRVPS